jgi:hypothetical protein
VGASLHYTAAISSAAGQSAAPKMQDLKDDSGQCRAAAPAEFHYPKAFENTTARLWVERDPKTLSPGYRAFHVHVPAKGGQRHLGISFKSPTPEAAPKQIAQTPTAAK